MRQPRQRPAPPGVPGRPAAAALRRLDHLDRDVARGVGSGDAEQLPVLAGDHRGELVRAELQPERAVAELDRVDAPALLDAPHHAQLEGIEETAIERVRRGAGAARAVPLRSYTSGQNLSRWVATILPLEFARVMYRKLRRPEKPCRMLAGSGLVSVE